MAIKKYSKEINSDGHIIITYYDKNNVVMSKKDINHWKIIFVSSEVNEYFMQVKYLFEKDNEAKHLYKVILKNNEEYIFDKPLKLSDIHFNKNNQLEYISIPNGVVYHFIYDRFGNKIMEADSCGWIETNKYNEDGQLIHRTIRDVDESVLDTDYFYDYEDNQYSLEEDESVYQNVLLIKKDSLGRLIYSKSLSDEEYIIRNDYNSEGKLSYHEDCGVVTKYEYNEYGDNIKWENTEGDWSETEYEYWGKENI